MSAPENTKAIELQHNRILGDMDFYIKQLLQIDGRLLAFKEMVFGQEVLNESEPDVTEPDTNFLAQRDLKHDRIARLLSMIQEKLGQIERF